MKKIFVATLAVAALLLAGCAKNEQNAPQGRIVRVSAGADELISKVSSSTSGRFTWRSGDAIGIWTGSGITKFTLVDEWDGFGYGEFVGELPEGGAITADSYAVYPYDENGTATATSFQWSAAEQFNIPASRYMLYAKGEIAETDGKVANFTFHHTTAYFRTTVKNIRPACNGLYIESAGPAFAMSAAVDFSGETPVVTYPNKGENIVYALPEHNKAIDATVIVPIMAGDYAQYWGKGGLKYRIACYSEPNWTSTKFDDYAGFFGEGTGFTVSIGEYYVLPDIKCANAKNADDSGTGINDGIEDSNVNVQNPDGFWEIKLN